MTPIVKTFLAWTALQFILAPAPILLGLVASCLVLRIFPQTAPWVAISLWLINKITQALTLVCVLIFLVAMRFGIVALYRWIVNGASPSPPTEAESSMSKDKSFTDQMQAAIPVPAASPLTIALGILFFVLTPAGAITFNLLVDGAISVDKSAAENIAGVVGFMAGGLEAILAGFVMCLIVFSIRRWRDPVWLADASGGAGDSNSKA